MDWWFLYKVPKLMEKSGTGSKLSATGYEYVYFDTVQNKTTYSPNQLNNGKGALDLTLNAIFTNHDASTGWILYNDEAPADAGEKDNSLLGHTKGVIAFDVTSKTAIWLLHSWPKYADPGVKTMPTPMYGQTFLCLSIDLATASALAKQMAVYQQPEVYLPHIPKALAKTDPLYALTQPLSKTVPGGTNSIACRTRGGVGFNVIAKNREWGKDFLEMICRSGSSSRIWMWRLGSVARSPRIWTATECTRLSISNSSTCALLALHGRGQKLRIIPSGELLWRVTGYAWETSIA